MEEVRDESIESVLTACPELEETIVTCIEDCDLKMNPPPKAITNQYLMSKVTNDSQDDIIQMTNSAKVSDTSGLQGAALLAVLMDGNQYFNDEERILIGVDAKQK